MSRDISRFLSVVFLSSWLVACAAETAESVESDGAHTATSSEAGKADLFGETPDGERRSCLTTSPSPCLAEDPLRIGSRFADWYGQLVELERTGIADETHGMTECRWVHEVQGALLCASEDRRSMNAPLARATIYVEGIGEERGEVVSTTDYAYERAVRLIAGHDLRSQDLLRFYAAASRECELDSTKCLTQSEEAMRDLVVLTEWSHGPFVLLTFALTADPVEVTTHEIRHAQYFLDEAYRAVADEYWYALDLDTQSDVIAALSEHYDTDDELLVRNEFQAYMLAGGGGGLSDLVPTHRDPLTTALRDAGSPPVYVQEFIVARRW